RIRTCRTDRAEWCEEASRARSAGLRIEPRWLSQQRRERLVLDVALAHPPQQQIAPLVDVAAQAFVARQALQILLRDRAESLLLPGVGVHHQVAREAFDQRGGRQIR